MEGLCSKDRASLLRDRSVFVPLATAHRAGDTQRLEHEAESPASGGYPRPRTFWSL